MVFTTPSLNVNARWNNVLSDPKRAKIAHDLAGLDASDASNASPSWYIPAASHERIDKASDSSPAQLALSMNQHTDE